MIYKEIRCRWLNRKVLYAARHKSSLFLWLYNNLLPLNVRLVLRKTPVSIYILVLYIYKQFKSGLAAPPLGEVTCYSVYILTLSTNYRTERTIYDGGLTKLFHFKKGPIKRSCEDKNGTTYSNFRHPYILRMILQYTV